MNTEKRGLKILKSLESVEKKVRVASLSEEWAALKNLKN